jgi:hypothetical protein
VACRPPPISRTPRGSGSAGLGVGSSASDFVPARCPPAGTSRRFAHQAKNDERAVRTERRALGGEGAGHRGSDTGTRVGDPNQRLPPRKAPSTSGRPLVAPTLGVTGARALALQDSCSQARATKSVTRTFVVRSRGAPLRGPGRQPSPARLVLIERREPLILRPQRPVLSERGPLCARAASSPSKPSTTRETGHARACSEPSSRPPPR